MHCQIRDHNSYIGMHMQDKNVLEKWGKSSIKELQWTSYLSDQGGYITFYSLTKKMLYTSISDKSSILSAVKKTPSLPSQMEWP